MEHSIVAKPEVGMEHSIVAKPAQDFDDLVLYNSYTQHLQEDSTQVAHIHKRAEELFEEFSSKQLIRSHSVGQQKQGQEQLLRQQWDKQHEAVSLGALNSNLDNNLKFVEAHVHLKARGGGGLLHKVRGIQFEESQCIPYLKAFAYLRRNQLASDEGKIMYKIDKDEELLPVVDDQSSLRNKDVGQFRVEYMLKTQVVRKIVQEFGSSQSCEKALRKSLGIDSVQLSEIIQSIERTDSKQQPLISEFSSSRQILDYWMLQGQRRCRICYTDTCLRHAEAQMASWPVREPFKLVEACEACGPQCYLNWGGTEPPTSYTGDQSSLTVTTGQSQQQQDDKFLNGQTKRKQLQNGFSNGYEGQLFKRLCRAENKQCSSSPEQMQAVNSFQSSNQFGSREQWSAVEEESLKLGLNSNEELTPCQIADIIISKPCFEVNKRLRTFPVNYSLKQIAKQIRNVSRRRKSSKLPCMKFREQIQQQGGKFNQYTPCTCVGQCNPLQCMCVTSGNFCDKFCACAKQGCDNSWGGCQCWGDCGTKQCRCFSAERECDPDLCVNCCPFIQYDSRKITCSNMGLRKGEHKHVIMGISDVQGWGAFINQPVEAGHLIGEYTGDIISNQEAERRGTVYDTMNLSYLFDLNKQQVVDAFNKGNKLRFANHSTRPNCQVRNLFVNGEHRLGIFAAKQLKKGDELLYDYKYSCDTAPQWAKQLGIVVDTEKDNKRQNKQNKKKQSTPNKNSPAAIKQDTPLDAFFT